MSHQAPERRKSFSKWLNIQYDALFALRDHTMAALRELLDRIVTIVRAAPSNRSTKPKSAQSLVPQFEVLEVRLVPFSSFGVSSKPLDPVLPAIAQVGNSDVRLNTGNLHVEVAAAKNYSILEQDSFYYYAGLVYNSDTASPQPLIGVKVAGATVTTGVDATLTWDSGTPQSQVSFGVGNFTSGSFYLTLQVNSPVTVPEYIIKQPST